MKNKIFNTNNDWTGLVTRLSIGLILFPHGAQQMLGIFGGYGFSGSMFFLTGTLHLPWLIAFLVITIQFFGSIFLVTGFASRIWSITLIVIFIGTIFTAHIDNGFFMNWYGTQKGEGFEYALLVVGLSIATLLNGSGKYSIDSIILKG
jgi:putative oxidoreductase